MKLYIREKVFSWGDRFFVKDAWGEDRYEVQGEVFTLGKRLHIYDMAGREVALIRQKLLSWMPVYEVYVDGELRGSVRRAFTFLRPRYTVEELGWEIQGSFMAHDYEITRGAQRVATVQKEWMTWGDSYELDIADEGNALMVLAAVIVMDCVMEDAANSANS